MHDIATIRVLSLVRDHVGELSLMRMIEAVCDGKKSVIGLGCSCGLLCSSVGVLAITHTPALWQEWKSPSVVY